MEKARICAVRHKRWRKAEPTCDLDQYPDMQDALSHNDPRCYARSSWKNLVVHWSPYKTSERKSNHDREENHFGIGASGQCNNDYFGERTWRRLHSM